MPMLRGLRWVDLLNWDFCGAELMSCALTFSGATAIAVMTA